METSLNPQAICTERQADGVLGITAHFYEYHGDGWLAAVAIEMPVPHPARSATSPGTFRPISILINWHTVH